MFKLVLVAIKQGIKKRKSPPAKIKEEQPTKKSPTITFNMTIGFKGNNFFCSNFLSHHPKTAKKIAKERNTG
jgi:hypothetical protein